MDGVAKYNEDNGKDVQVVRLEPTATKKGSFTNDFKKPKTKGQNAARGMLTPGADIVVPVAGPAGLGALQAVKEEGAKAIWVDTDGGIYWPPSTATCCSPR